MSTLNKGNDLPWNEHQQRFLDLLQDEENHRLSITKLWQKAGYANASYWYRAFKDPAFRDAVVKLRQQYGFIGSAAQAKKAAPPKWKDYYQTLLDLLQTPENRQLSPLELCQKAGLPNYGYWYRALEHPEFKEKVQAFGIIPKRLKSRDDSTSESSPKWGKTHQRFLDLLKHEGNRHLTILQLCQKAGFESRRSWYRALEHPEFRERVEALGIETNRLSFYYNEQAKEKAPKWTSTHQRLLAVLEIEENRQLSITQICQKAGFTHLQAWYFACQHPQFRAALEALGVEIERCGLYQQGSSRAQKAILNVLRQPANRELPIIEICRKAGYSDDYWYKSLASKDFVRELEQLGVDVYRRQYNENGWTELQQSLLDCLQDPANRQLRPTELCQKAGYPNCTYWIRALKNPRFVEAVEALGVTIWRKGLNKQGFTRSQQKFLDLLQDDPVITAAELCRKAGHQSTSSWSGLIHVPHFMEHVETQDYQVIRIPRSINGMTYGQHQLLAGLQDKSLHSLPIKEICRRAGYSEKLWHRALKSPKVAAAIRDLGIRICRSGPDENGWTWAQQRLLEVLADEDNRKLSIIELCRTAGYSDLSRWYESLSSEQFRALLEEWNVPISRQHEPYTPHIYIRPAMNTEEVLNQDIWDIRKLKPNYPKHRHPGDYILDFTWIKNPQLREQVKQYMRLRLPRWSAGTFSTELSALKSFFIHIPDDVHVGNLSRFHVEKAIPKILTQHTDSWAQRSLCSTRSMLNFIRRSRAWSEPKPRGRLLFSGDIPSALNALPRPIPPDVLQQLDPLLHQALQDMLQGKEPPFLEPVIWDVILILRRTGMRFGDLAHLEAPGAHHREGCLRQDADGDWWIHIRAETTKMRREHLIPSDDRDGTKEAILRQLKRVQDVPDHFGQSYLFRTHEGILTYKKFYKSLKSLAPSLLYLGQPYDITPHQFRHTIATDMIDKGVDILTVRDFLGHKSLMMTERYIKIYQQSKKKKFAEYQAKRTDYSDLPLPTYLQPPEVAQSQTREIMPGWVEGYEGRLYRFPLPNGLAVCEQPPRLQLSCVTSGQCSTSCTKMRAGHCYADLFSHFGGGDGAVP